MCVCVFSRVGGIFFIRGVEGGGESERGLSHHRFLRLFGEPSPFFFFFMVFCRFFFLLPCTSFLKLGKSCNERKKIAKKSCRLSMFKRGGG